MNGTDLVEDVRAGRSSVAAPSASSAGLEIGLGIVIIAVPLAFVPATYAPFVDVKLPLLLAGTLLVWMVHRTRSPLALPAAVWVGAVALAGTVGVDRWWSLVGPEQTGNGLILAGASAFLLVAAAGVPTSIRARIPSWLVGAATATGVVSLVHRWWPGVVGLLIPGLSFDGGTLGHPVALAGLLATGLVATVALDRLSPRWLVPVLVILSTALALSTKRVGWVALAVGLAVALWRTRLPRRRASLIFGVVVVTLAGWTAMDALLATDVPLSGASRFGELATDSARARLTAWPAMVRGWSRRPVLGWGPGNVWGAYVSSATESELRVAERGIGDAHNILIEAAVTTGAIGLMAFLGLTGFTVRQIRKGTPSMAWAAGSAAALGVYHLLQPNHLALTPLLFLLAGLAGPAPPDEAPSSVPGGPIREPRARRRPALARACIGLLLTGGLVVATSGLVASFLETYGRTYASEAALRASLRFAPGRVTAAEGLALSLALDGRAGDGGAEAEARELAARIARLHPWNPGVRLVAADVHILLRDPEGATVWVDRHMARFPRDVIPALPPEAAPPAPSGEQPS